MKLRVESDGNPANTHVYVVSRDGVEDELENVIRVDWAIGIDGRSQAVIVVNARGMEVDVETEQVQFVMDHPNAGFQPDPARPSPVEFIPEDSYEKYLSTRRPGQ